ncbi:uncharacterized protein LOC143275527 [Babylonia areolata]|uniref:uncharacterized protein LOC143275527 n=1 Tax=Babylonia areolata TaxID=304850 RepID=UPI003FD2BEF8
MEEEEEVEEEVHPARTAGGTTTLTSLPRDLPDNDTLTSLTVTDMDIQRVTSTDFSHVHYLRTLVLTRNRLESVDDGAFQSLTGLDTLLMNDNYLREVSDDMFMGLVVLKRLDLSRNRLVELISRSFLPLKNLEVLNLAWNEIEHVEDDAFVGLYRLQTLLLTGNRLMAVNGNQFRPLYSLMNLMLDNCSIQVVEFHTFSPLTRLTRLSLAHNSRLSFLLAEAFVSDSRTMLNVLSLRGTGLREVPVAALKTLTQLKNLDLSQTLIPVIRNDSFAHLDSLVNLTLDALPKLHKVDEEAFSGLSSLRYLTVSNNKLLSNISDGAFRNLSSLAYLDLANNNVETFPRGLADWRHVHTVDLRGNPLRCDCSAAWMLTVLHNHPHHPTTSSSSSSSRSKAGSQRIRHRCDRTSATNLGDKMYFTTETLTRMVACYSPPRLEGRCLLSLSEREMCSGDPHEGTGSGVRAGVLTAVVCCAVLLACVMLFTFRQRLCGVCRRRGGYSYQMHRNREVDPGSRQSSSLVDVLEMESTQLEDFRDPDL